MFKFVYVKVHVFGNQFLAIISLASVAMTAYLVP